MERQTDQEPELNPDRLAEKLGVPMPGPVNRLTVNTKLNEMYAKLTKADPARPFWVRIFAIFLSSIVFILPGLLAALIICNIFVRGINLKGSDLIFDVEGAIYLILGVAFLFIGIKIIYENIRGLKINIFILIGILIILGGVFAYQYFATKKQPVVQTQVQSSVTVLLPNGGEAVEPGQHVNITWNVGSNYPNVQIMVVAGKVADGQYTNNGSMASIRGYVIYTGANTGLFDWTVPTEYPDVGDYYIRIEPQTSNGQASGQVYYNDNDFSIIAPIVNRYNPVSITSPTSGAAPLTVRFSPGGCAANIEINYGDGTSCTTADPDGSENCDVFTHTYKNPGVYKAKESCYMGGGTVDVTITVQAAEPSITIISPKKGEVIQANTDYTIKWTSRNLGESNIEFDLWFGAFGAPQETIVAEAPNTGSFVWHVPIPQYPNSGLYFIRATPANSNSRVDSDYGGSEYFTIASNYGIPAILYLWPDVNSFDLVNKTFQAKISDYYLPKGIDISDTKANTDNIKVYTSESTKFSSKNMSTSMNDFQDMYSMLKIWVGPEWQFHAEGYIRPDGFFTADKISITGQ